LSNLAERTALAEVIAAIGTHRWLI